MRNVVVICLDTVRKDFFDVYARRLSRAADVSYAQCRAASSWSVPSHASMLTGALPSEHGVHDYQRSFEVVDRADTFLGDLGTHHAIGVSANVWAGPAFGFDRLFDDFRTVSPDRRYPGGIDVGEFGYECETTGLGRFLAFARASLRHENPLASLANGAAVELERIAEQLPVASPFDDGARMLARAGRRAVADGQEPFVLFANLMDAHAPLHAVRGYDADLHEVPPRWSSRSFDKWDLNLDGEAGLDRNRESIRNHRALYGAAIEYLDRVVMDFVTTVRDRTDRPVTVVVTSDHGENLGYPAEDYLFGHDASLSEGLLHVPLLLLNPPAGYEGTDQFVSHLDLRALVAHLGTGEVFDPGRERTAAELLGSTNAHPPTDEPYWTRSLRAVYDDRKYVWDSLGDSETYRLDPERPCWQERVSTGESIASLEAACFGTDIATARERAMASGDRADASGATRQRLRELGYL